VAGTRTCAGFAFDGDCDRIAPVDEDGNVITPHQVLALLVRHLVRNRREHGAVVKSVNIGRMVDLEAQALGVPLVVTPIGFKFVAAAMREQDALVGGEESGGFAVRGHIPERDPGLICLLLLECMAITGQSLGTLVREMEAAYGPASLRPDGPAAGDAGRSGPGGGASGRGAADRAAVRPLLRRTSGMGEADPSGSQLGHAAGLGDGAAAAHLCRGVLGEPGPGAPGLGTRGCGGEGIVASWRRQVCA